jgi:hypothetical protein
MSFSLYALACRSILGQENPDGQLLQSGLDALLQSKDGQVLGLHSCRALSP